MALMDQNEKNLLLEMAGHYEKRAAHCDIKLAQPGRIAGILRRDGAKASHYVGRQP